MRFADDPAGPGVRWAESTSEAGRVTAYALSGGLLYADSVGERQRPVVKLVRAAWLASGLALVALFRWSVGGAVVGGAALAAAGVLGTLVSLGAVVWVAYVGLGGAARTWAP